MVKTDHSLMIDTGIFVALTVKTDHYRKKVLDFLKTTEKYDWITTWPVITEACHLIGRYSTQEVEKLWLSYEEGLFEIYDLKKEQIPRIKELMNKYRKLPMDLADASLVILAEYLGHGKILSTDQRDFQSYRWKNHHPFENLFL